MSRRSRWAVASPKTTRTNPQAVQLWWVSWKETTSPADSRPLHCPPGEQVIAWWESGFAADESYATMVAVVRAATVDDIEKAIAKDWPSRKGARNTPREWRFRELIDLTEGLKIGDRFPFDQWSLDRLKALGIKTEVVRRAVKS